MMKINSFSGAISFSCIICQDEDDESVCMDCLKERSTFDVAFKAGKSNQPSNILNYSGLLKEIYQTGFNQGALQSKGLQHANA
jgi:hypothetical protein